MTKTNNMEEILLEGFEKEKVLSLLEQIHNILKFEDKASSRYYRNCIDAVIYGIFSINAKAIKVQITEITKEKFIFKILFFSNLDIDKYILRLNDAMEYLNDNTITKTSTEYSETISYIEIANMIRLGALTANLDCSKCILKLTFVSPKYATRFLPPPRRTTR